MTKIATNPKPLSLKADPSIAFRNDKLNSLRLHVLCIVYCMMHNKCITALIIIERNNGKHLIKDHKIT